MEIKPLVSPQINRAGLSSAASCCNSQVVLPGPWLSKGRPQHQRHRRVDLRAKKCTPRSPARCPTPTQGSCPCPSATPGNSLAQRAKTFCCVVWVRLCFGGVAITYFNYYFFLDKFFRWHRKNPLRQEQHRAEKAALGRMIQLTSFLCALLCPHPGPNQSISLQTHQNRLL